MKGGRGGGGVFIMHTAGFHLGGGGAKGGVCPPLDFDFILPHSLVVDATQRRCDTHYTHAHE